MGENLKAFILLAAMRINPFVVWHKAVIDSAAFCADNMNNADSYSHQNVPFYHWKTGSWRFPPPQHLRVRWYTVETQCYSLSPSESDATAALSDGSPILLSPNKSPVFVLYYVSLPYHSPQKTKFKIKSITVWYYTNTKFFFYEYLLRIILN